MEMLSGSDLQFLSSDQIQELFVLLKKSTNCLDKVGLKYVQNALKWKRAQETELDTGESKVTERWLESLVTLSTSS